MHTCMQVTIGRLAGYAHEDYAYMHTCIQVTIGRLVGYAHEDALFRFDKLEHVDLSGWPELREVRVLGAGYRRGPSSGRCVC